MANGTFGNSKPCYLCVKLLKYLGYKNVIYGDIDGNLHKEKVTALEEGYKTWSVQKFMSQNVCSCC